MSNNPKIMPAGSVANARPWQMHALESLADTPPPPVVVEAFVPPVINIEAVPSVADQQQLETLREEAIAAGREQGLQLGHEAGLLEGRQQAAAELTHLSGLLQAATLRVQTLENALPPAVIDLALAMARQILRAELQLKPEHVLAVVREAVDALPHPLNQPKLFLHPADTALVRTVLGNELENNGWFIYEASDLQAGDCRIEFGSGTLDARLSTRWQALVQAFDRNLPLVDSAAP